MRKIFKVLIVLLVATSVIGCSSTVKTTVANQEEWEAVMEPSSMLMARQQLHFFLMKKLI